MKLLVQHLDVARESSAHCLIVGTQTIPFCGGVVRPLLESLEGCRVLDPGKVMELALKFGLSIR